MLFGLLITFAATIIYSIRFSFVKDLAVFKIPKSQVNLFYRIFSLPIIIAIVLILKENVLHVQPQFIVWFFISLSINIVFALYQVHAFQKHKFSSIESLSFTGIVFSTLLGVIVFGEKLLLNQIIGIALTLVAFFILAVAERKEIKVNKTHFLEMLFYYLFGAITDLGNKQSIQLSSPLTYVFYLTLGTIIVYFFLGLKEKNLYKLNDIKANKLLVLIGVCAALSFIGISFGYKYLPLGVLATVLSSETFISLWISHKKYNEKDLGIKIFASIVAFIGLLILFIF